MLSSPTCEIVTIGSELLLGQITDTNTTYLARELGRAGITILFRTAVGDRLTEIVEVLKRALDRCHMVLVTGGLGPTLDDMTREAAAEVAGVDLEFRPELMAEIEEMFRRAGYQMPDNNRRQAFVPAGSHAISNPVGTAPGFISEVRGRPLICLPGVPRELKYLMDKEVTAWIRQRFALHAHRVIYRVLKTVGIGESKVDSLIGDLIRPGQNPEIGLLASMGEIKVRIAANARDEDEAQALIRPVEEEICSRLGNKIFGKNEDTLEGVIESLLCKNHTTLALVETFTGGTAALRLHGLPSTRLVESRVIPGRERLERFSGQRLVESGPEGALDLARKIREKGEAGVGLVIAGFPEEGKAGGYTVQGLAGAVGRVSQKAFAWEMSGDLFTLQQRGAVIGLNTLRLVLLEAEKV